MFRPTPLWRLVPLILCAVVLSAFAQSRDDHTNGLVGTWKWVSVDGHRVDQPFYIRYETNGVASTWPAPKGWSDSKGVSRGHYSLEHGYVVLVSPGNEHGPKARLDLHTDTYVLTTDEGHRLTYRRLVTPPEPGFLENKSPAGFTKNPM